MSWELLWVFLRIVFNFFERLWICVSFFAKSTKKLIFPISEMHSNNSLTVIKYNYLPQIYQLDIFIHAAMLFSNQFWKLLILRLKLYAFNVRCSIQSSYSIDFPELFNVFQYVIRACHFCVQGTKFFSLKDHLLFFCIS